MDAKEKRRKSWGTNIKGASDKRPNCFDYFCTSAHTFRIERKTSDCERKTSETKICDTRSDEQI